MSFERSKKAVVNDASESGSLLGFNCSTEGACLSEIYAKNAMI